MKKVVLFLAFTLQANGQSLQACRNPSNPGQRIICNNIFGWNYLAKDAPVSFAESTLPKETSQGPEGMFLGLAAIAAGGPPSDKYQCMNWQCVCNFVQGESYSNGACQLPDGGTLSRRPRQEYRMMTDAARIRYTQGFRAVVSTIYSTLAASHSDAMRSPGAHAGPAFLPWHREFLRRLEIGIRTAPVNGQYPYWSVTIPYWDNTMDADIYTLLRNQPTGSVMFSNELIGSAQNGFLTDGQFANFAGRQGRTRRQLNRWPGQLLLMSRADVDSIIATHTANQVLGATAGSSGCPALPRSTLELIHGNPHIWIGGNMEPVQTSTNDPLFFLHHSFIDFVWEEWRTRRQTSAQRETQYNTAPAACYSAAHRANARMVPFSGLVNSDGLSNIYTQVFYNYAPRPQCSASTRNCGSRFLWCYVPGSRCVSRLKVNQRCRIVSGVDPCYQGRCSSRSSTRWGKCVANPVRQADETRSFDSLTVPKLDDYPFETCFNNNPCCEFLSRNDGCKDANIWNECKASCKVCSTIKKYADACEDRHHLCKIFEKDGYCAKYPEYMAENCRSTCNLCRTTRVQHCAGKLKPISDEPLQNTGDHTKPILTEKSNKSLSCTNQNICCQYWKDTKSCDKMGVFRSQCAASCYCKPIHDLHSCSDFYNNCNDLKNEGKCKEPIVQENCRNTCGSCPTATALKDICG